MLIVDSKGKMHIFHNLTFAFSWLRFFGDYSQYSDHALQCRIGLAYEEPIKHDILPGVQMYSGCKANYEHFNQLQKDIDNRDRGKKDSSI